MWWECSWYGGRLRFSPSPRMEWGGGPRSTNSPCRTGVGWGRWCYPGERTLGALVSALEVVEGEDVMVVSAGGKVFRVPVVDVPGAA